MAESIYEWMRNLACYFIFLSAVMHFIPENSYKKYIQYYMGLLLILLLLSPLLHFMSLDERIEENFEQFLYEEEENQKEWEDYGKKIQEKYTGGFGIQQERREP